MNGLSERGQSLLQEVFEVSEWEGGNRTTLVQEAESISSVKGASPTPSSTLVNNINISGGNVQFHQNAHGHIDSQKSFGDIQRTKDSVQLELYNNKISSQKSVFSALAFLQSAREKEYLPPNEEIKRRKENYYSGIIPNIGSLSKEELYDELHVQISSTLKIASSYPDVLQLEKAFGPTSLEGSGASYDRSRAHLYTWVDLREDRVLRCVYTDAIIAPEQLLLKDLITKLRLKDHLPRRYSNNQFLNCEHIIPQSWFEKETVGVADLHHLITADGATNNFRSDCWYDDLGQSGKDGPNNLPEYIDSGGWKSGDGDQFEPKRNKALVARASLYFLVAHKGKLLVRKYSNAQIKTLIEWAKSEEPSNYEKHRNESIFEIQGNRNPFIDFPRLIDKVDFTRSYIL